VQRMTTTTTATSVRGETNKFIQTLSFSGRADDMTISAPLCGLSGVTSASASATASAHKQKVTSCATPREKGERRAKS